MAKRQWKTGLSWLFISVAWFVIGWITRGIFTGAEVRLYVQAREIIDHCFDGIKVDKRELTYASIKGMLGRLNDKYANFYPAGLIGKLQQYRNGDFSVIGASLEQVPGGIKVTALTPGYGAEAAGLLAGDMITAIDGHPVAAGDTLGEAALRIMQNAGSQVSLQVVRGQMSLHFSAELHSQKIVSSRLIDADTGYIKLVAFTANAPQLMQEHLTGLLKENIATLIWDLRSNDGGSVEAAVEVINLFISDGLIMTDRRQDGRTTAFRAAPAHCLVPADVEILVLVNRYSMSAAEVSAAALGENRRARIIGERTHGKGTINVTYSLSDGSCLELTGGRWYSPSGKNYQDKGIVPAVAVADDMTAGDAVLETALALVKR